MIYEVDAHWFTFVRSKWNRKVPSGGGSRRFTFHRSDVGKVIFIGVGKSCTLVTCESELQGWSPREMHAVASAAKVRAKLLTQLEKHGITGHVRELEVISEG